MAETPRTIRVEPSTYRVVLEPLTPDEYRRVMDALAPLNLGPLLTATAEVEVTEDLAVQITGAHTVANPAVSIAGQDLPFTCQRCGHTEAQHTGPATGRLYGPQCDVRLYGPRNARCQCAGWVPGGGRS